MCSAHFVSFKPLFAWHRTRGVWNLLKSQQHFSNFYFSIGVLGVKLHYSVRKCTKTSNWR
jgi:hypothetical protein